MILLLKLLIVFLIGMTLAFKIENGMTIYELLLIPATPFLFFRFARYEMWNKVNLFLLISFSLFIISLSLSSLYAGDELMIALKNILRWVMVFPMAISFFYLQGQFKNFVLILLLGYAVANSFYVINETGWLLGESTGFWRLEVGEAISIAMVAIGAYWGGRALVMTVLFVVLLNLFLDFRSIAAVGLVFLLYNFYSMFAKGWRRTLFLLISGICLVGFYYAYNNINADSYEVRRDLSNTMRLDVTLAAIDDLMSISVLGNGYLHFFKVFQVISGENSYFDMTESEMPIHGYLWTVSYEAGKLGFLFMVYLDWLVVRKIVKFRQYVDGESQIKIFLALYFIYGNFMFAYSGFDRILIALIVSFVLFDRNKRFLFTSEKQLDVRNEMNIKVIV